LVVFDSFNLLLVGTVIFQFYTILKVFQINKIIQDESSGKKTNLFSTKFIVYVFSPKYFSHVCCWIQQPKIACYQTVT